MDTLTDEALIALLVGSEEEIGWLPLYRTWEKDKSLGKDKSFEILLEFLGILTHKLWGLLMESVHYRLVSLGLAPGAPVIGSDHDRVVRDDRGAVELCKAAILPGVVNPDESSTLDLQPVDRARARGGDQVVTRDRGRGEHSPAGIELPDHLELIDRLFGPLAGAYSRKDDQHRQEREPSTHGGDR